MLYIGGRTSALANARSRFGVKPFERHRTTTLTAVAALMGMALIAGGTALSWVAMEDRNDETSMAIVTSGDIRGAHTLKIDGHDAPVTLEANRLHIGERVFVRIDHTAESARLVGALDDGRFAFAIAMWITGIALAVPAARRYRWAARCRTLAALAASIEPPAW